jgi:hypothetical protein
MRGKRIHGYRLPIARISLMEPIRTDFTGYEGQYVAIDWRTGEIVLADDDPRVVLEQAKGRNHVVVHGRVPYADEPIYVGLG